MDHIAQPRVRSLRYALLAAMALSAGAAPGSVSAGEESGWHAVPGGRWRGLPALATQKPGFTRMASDTTGITFTNTLEEAASAANRVLNNGAGVATGDFDGDGQPDLFLCDLGGKNALYRNLGHWRFEDVTAQAGLSTLLPATRGAVFADVNGDGNLDLLLTVNGRGALCFMNTGRGGFVDATSAAGTASTAGSTSLALADVDGNGTLDLYVVNYRPDDVRDRGRVSMKMINGRPVLPGGETNRFLMIQGRVEECGQPDQLFLNDGLGHFKPVPWTGGAFLDESGQPLQSPPLDWGLTAAFRDLNGDGDPDLYVCNDYWTPDRFWINDGRGHFRAAEPWSLRKTSASCMSVDFADIDRDGLLDFFTVDMLSRNPRLRKRESYAQMLVGSAPGVIDDRPQVMRNCLFLNRGDGTFAEIAYQANLQASDWSWAPQFLDVDLDGYEDLLIGAGHFRDVQDYDAEAQVRARQHSWDGFQQEQERQKAFTRELLEHNRLYPPLQMPLGAFRNLGNCSFEEVTEAWGLNHPGVHQGLAFADFDGDGDLDLVVNSLNGAAALYRNEGSANRIKVTLKGKAPNSQGIGAKITLFDGAVPIQTTEIASGGHYQSGSDAVVSFAAGSGTAGMRLEACWRGGTKTTLAEVLPNRVYEIQEATAQPSPRGVSEKTTPLFEDVSPRLGHRHREPEFNDFERQPLLPFKLSQMGPGIAWVDLAGDGSDDLVIGSGRGGRIVSYRNDHRGGFKPSAMDQAQELPDDVAGIVGWVGTDGKRGVIAALTGYESKATNGALRLSWVGDRLDAGVPLGGDMATGGAIAIADLLGDGKLALFVAGGVSPGHYPVGRASKLYRQEAGQWRLDHRNSAILDNLGIVNGAVWSDLDGDGLPELILACEWGPIRVFQNRKGALFEVTEEWGLKPSTGWWRGVTTGDLNGDGQMDIIASNWGWNSPYRASPAQPLTFVYGQMAQPGVTEVIETEYLEGKLSPTRQFLPLANSLSFLFERFATHRAYSEATLDEVLGDRMPLAKRVTATTLATTLFLNQGKKFHAVPLPKEAQFAPAFSVQVADFDGDGKEDVFLSQNFFNMQPEIARIDAGLGLVLRGDGKGGLLPMKPGLSGIRVQGEQRGAAVGDFDQDGRPDLVVTQNGAATRLFRNNTGKPGLRVGLQGLPGNPSGIGAVLRLLWGSQEGPAREVHCGSGYWSQDSLTQVLATPSQPDALRIRWPGGKQTTTLLPLKSTEVVVDSEGKLLSNR